MMRMRRRIELTAVALLFVAPPVWSQEAAPVPAVFPGGERDLTVSGDATAVLPVKAVELTINLSQTAATASEALRQIDEREKKVRDALAQLGLTAPITRRNEKVLSSTQPTLTLKPGIAVNAERDLLVRFDRFEALAALIERVLAVPGTTISDVRSEAASDGDAVPLAIDRALASAEQKARVAAKRLNVTLGRVLSVTVSEETDGAAVREEMERGTPPGKYSDRHVRVFAVVRYALP